MPLMYISKLSLYPLCRESAPLGSWRLLRYDIIVCSGCSEMCEKLVKLLKRICSSVRIAWAIVNGSLRDSVHVMCSLLERRAARRQMSAVDSICNATVGIVRRSGFKSQSRGHYL